MYDAKGSVFGDLNAPNSPASVASRYFLAPQAKVLRISRPKVPISRQNGAPGSSTGKPKVVGNRELSRSPHSNSALLNGKEVQFTQASNRPYSAAYVWGACSCPWGSLRRIALPERYEGSASGSGSGSADRPS